MSEQYAFMKRLSELYGLLEDELSKKLFWARMRYDAEPSIDAAIQLYGVAANLNNEEMEQHYRWKERFFQILSEGNKIYLYGVGVCGRETARLLLKAGGDFSGFCDQNAELYTEGICGKEVISPQKALVQGDNAYYIITTIDYYVEIYNFLLRNGVNESHIIPFLGNVKFVETWKKQYFEFCELFEKGTAFVDGGCYNCGDSLRFAAWCEGQYSQIYAFEPDGNNYENCKEILRDKKLLNTEVIQAGLGKQHTKVLFAAAGGTGGHTIDAGSEESRNYNCTDSTAPVEEITIVALDDIAKDTKIGFIKLDIEGEEYNALVGSRETIVRDKPFLAICIYHKQGDVLAIMDYLKQLVPEYHFCIRHYSMLGYETVLYASTKSFL